MLETFAKTFEKMCSICAGVNYIIFCVLGGIIGYFIGYHILYDYEALLFIGFIIIGVLIAHINYKCDNFWIYCSNY